MTPAPAPGHAPAYDLIIFDCDGVLIDSEVLACRIDAEELTSLGFPIGYEDVVRRFTGIPADGMRSLLEAEWGRSLPEEYEARVAARVEAAFRSELAPIAGVHDLLAGLTVPFCVASSSALPKLRLGLAVTDLLDFFEPNVFSASMVARGKPAPDLFLYAAERMGGIRPERALVIEDSVAGVQAAVSAGMPVIGFLGGGHCGPGHADRLKAAGARELVLNHAELVALVEALPTPPRQHGDHPPSARSQP
jgi:HAD superfamily hydrolase (TIGR01509 family)